MSAVRVSGTARVVRSPTGRRRRRSRAAGPRRRACARSRRRTAGCRRRGRRSARTADSGQAGDEAGEQLRAWPARQRFERERHEVPFAGAPVRPLLDELRAREGHDVDGQALAPLEHVVDEVEQAGVGVVEVFEDHDHRRARGQSLEERAPGAEELLGPDVGAHAQQGQQGGLDPAPLGVVRDELVHLGRDRGARRRLVVCLSQSAPAADHLAQRPEADALAVGRRAPAVPPDGVDEAIDVLEELPGQPTLADAGRTDDRDEPDALLAARGVEEVLEQAELLVAADEGRLEPLAAVASADLGHDPQRAPGRDRAGLALEQLLAGLFEGDGRRCRPMRRLADQDGARRCDRLQSRRGIDEVAGDHALFVAPRVTAASPVSTPARASMPGPRARTASTSSRPARTARSASSSRATGAPQTAMTASPMNFSTVPP